MMRKRSLFHVLVVFGLSAAVSTACGNDGSGGDDEDDGAAGEQNESGGSAGEKSSSGGKSSTGGRGDAGSGVPDGGGDGEGGDDGSGGEGEAPPKTHDEILAGLGLNTNLGGLKDKRGQSLPTEYHPLRKPITTFRPRAETYVAGILWDAGQNNPRLRDVLFDDKAGSERYGRLDYHAPSSDTWTNSVYKNAIMADLDGDGLDEILAIYYVEAESRLDYVLFDPGDNTSIGGTLVPNATAPTQEVVDSAWQQPNLAKGDFDGDGKQEVAIGWFGLAIAELNAKGDITVTQRSLAIDGVTPDGEAVFVAGGDLDGDANDELAVTYSTGAITEGRVRIYDGSERILDRQMAFTHPNPTSAARTCRQAQVGIADIDGDHLGEVVFFGRTYGNGWDYRWQVFLMDDLQNAPEANPWVPFDHDGGYTEGEVPNPFVLLDVNGDSVADIFAGENVLYVDHDSQYRALPTPRSLAIKSLAGVGGVNPRVAAGDVDGDGKDDLLMEGSSRIWAVGLNDINQVEYKQQGTEEWRHTSENTVGSDAGWRSLIIATGNVDEDSALVRYDGDHELLFTDPHIVAVIGSPPYYEGIGQDIDNTTSTFGTSVGSSSSSSQSVGFSVGFSVGYHTDFLFGEASFKVEVEQSFDYSAFQSRSFTKSVAYTTAPGEDLVVFTAIPFDVYYYTIVDSPTEAEIGTKFTLNIPRAPQTVATDIPFFNKRTGPDGLKITDAILEHRLGDPTSYKTRADMLEIAKIAGASIGDLAQVSQSGTRTSTIQLDSEKGTGQSMDLSVTFSWEVEAATGPTVGGSVGFSYGHSYEISTTESTFFEGTVGSVPGDEFSDHSYGWGLMAYPKALGNQRFPVLDYWVE